MNQKDTIVYFMLHNILTELLLFLKETDYNDTDNRISSKIMYLTYPYLCWLGFAECSEDGCFLVCTGLLYSEQTAIKTIKTRYYHT